MPRTALFVVDIQVELAQDPTTSIPHASRIRDAGQAILSKVRSHIDTARLSGLPSDLEIVVVQHEEDAKDGTLVRGSKAWDVVFPPREGDDAERLVSKTVRDTFESNPELAYQLKKRGVETVVVFGIQSECCVLSTGKGALAAGFKVVVLRGAHSTYDVGGKKAEEIEKEVEEQLGHDGAEVIPWEDWKP